MLLDFPYLIFPWVLPVNGNRVCPSVVVENVKARVVAYHVPAFMWYIFEVPDRLTAGACTNTVCSFGCWCEEKEGFGRVQLCGDIIVPVT